MFVLHMFNICYVFHYILRSCPPGHSLRNVLGDLPLRSTWLPGPPSGHFGLYGCRLGGVLAALAANPAPNAGLELAISPRNISRLRVAARYSGGALCSRCFQEVMSLGNRAGSWVWVKQQALNERIPPTRWGRTPWLVWCHLAGVSGQPPC